MKTNRLFADCRIRNQEWHRIICLMLFVCFFSFTVQAQKNIRQEISLNEGWHTAAFDDVQNIPAFEKPAFNVRSWIRVDVPHNWDRYEGYRRMRHGNRHGSAAYRKKFAITEKRKGKRYFLFFEGVGSYATVWLNGTKVGYHAGGRTTFTLDITDHIRAADSNVLAVRADHPSGIRDLPWICGGCSEERGFSEGSQPMGIFRPVQLIVTDELRIQPFGIHIWNDSSVTEKLARLQVATELKNYGRTPRNFTLRTRLLDARGVQALVVSKDVFINTGITQNIKLSLPEIRSPRLWSPDDPYLYTLVAEVLENGKLIDQVQTRYGIRTVSWPMRRGNGSSQFLINGKPVFINGVAEYEHKLGGSHAFTDAQVRTRAMQIRSAGFNAFRDAHQPHNLRYGQHWDSLGIFLWTQLSAHAWFDTDSFRQNFKTLLADWVKERRNHPSVIMWGLQNESKLPEDFARECMELIRTLDPTASSQRLVVTCNGGSGTDWDVPQNWTGTYGGNPATYGADLQRQILVGEYGAWRTLDLHTEGSFDQNGIYSEDRMTQLMEWKVRLADSVKNSTAGHYMWLFSSHDNPGRVQGGEGFRDLDRIGPVNYKGLLTPWEEPLDAFYMYRSNFAPVDREPMVYIVSHTWPDRWTEPGIKNGITVYSNCDEVELFNDVNQRSLGKRSRGGRGTPFRWDSVDVQYNLLYAVGYSNGKVVAKDFVILHHLPSSPQTHQLVQRTPAITEPEENFHYVYRVNCGGNAYTDVHGHTWMADRRRAQKNAWGSSSWTDAFPGLPPFFASQRRSFDPVSGTSDETLFQSFRYGTSDLTYHFPLVNGKYLLELYFTEPWLGTGGGLNCTGWRQFDVAANGKTILKDLDIWKEVGHDAALKKRIMVDVTGGELVLSFPKTKSGQALISAIAIATKSDTVMIAPPSPALAEQVSSDIPLSLMEWMDTGEKQYTGHPEKFSYLPSELHGATWFQLSREAKGSMIQFTLTEAADVFVGIDTLKANMPGWLREFEVTGNFVANSSGERFDVFRKRFKSGDRVTISDDTGAVPIALLAMVPTSRMEPAYDLKPVHNYKALSAKLTGTQVGIKELDGRQRVVMEPSAIENAVEWNFSVGVADIYSLTVTYNSIHPEVYHGQLELYAADGTLMKTEVVSFHPTREGKWNYINSSSGSMINAGHYVLKLRTAPRAKLMINALDVQ